MINLPSHIFKQIKKESLSNSPNECCGFLLEIDNKLSIFKCSNAADNKLHNFLISPQEYIKASNTGKIVYIYHSHPSETHDYSFSSLDKINSVGHKIPMILYNIHNDKFSIFDDNELELKYIGYPFEYNKHDCLSLVEEFYEKEFNIKLPKIDRDSKTLKETPNLMINNITYYGFNEINKEEKLKYGDILITNGKNGPSHLLIYVNNNQILHHPINSYSTICQYTNSHKDNTVKILRHQSAC